MARWARENVCPNSVKFLHILESRLEKSRLGPPGGRGARHILYLLGILHRKFTKSLAFRRFGPETSEIRCKPVTYFDGVRGFRVRGPWNSSPFSVLYVNLRVMCRGTGILTGIPY